MNSRPKPSDTEEDILKLQEEFLKNKQTPSVKLVKTENAIDSVPNQSRETNNVPNKQPPILIGSIIEHKTTSAPVQSLTPRFLSGFPQAKKRLITNNASKGSIFSQQNKKLKEENIVTKPSTSKDVLPTRSYILTGNESQEIHKENINTLSKMSEAEILEERNKLLNSLDPDIVKFLKSKRQKIENTTDTKTNEIEIQEPNVDIEEIETPKEIIDNLSTEKWLHFDAVETEKLQWMKNIKIPQKPENGEPYEARFDFNGWLLPFVEPEISEKNRSLYHHGEEPGRPGYTLKELFKLCRSNVNQQRILALNTISNILSLNSSGIYDNIIDIPIEQIFFIIRVCLDDNSPPILNASIKAMHHLFYSLIDETCLDSLIGFGLGLPQPMLSIKSDNNLDDKEINDQQLAEMNLIQCLIRTDILIRIRYIINTVQPALETINYCLEILIRLMRDSQSIMLQVFHCDNLFKSIINNFVPKIYKLEIMNDRCYGIPVLSAIKLMRISAARSKTIAYELINRYQIMESICSYIANDIAINTLGVKLQIESFNLFSVFLHYNLAVDYISELAPFLIRSVDYHLKNTNIDIKTSFTIQNHFGSLLNVISQITKINYNLISNFISLLMQCFAKYSSQISNLTKFECGKLQIISSLLITLTNIIKSSSIKNDDYLNKLIESLISSSGFMNITNNIKGNSNLLCEFDCHNTGPNISSLEAAIWGTPEHIIPVLFTNSCIPFLTALSYFVENSNNEVILKFLLHPNIITYLETLKNSSKFNLISNWFTKLESQLLINIFKSAIKAQKNIPNHMLYYELSVKSLNIFNIEQKSDTDYILKNIIFNKQFYPNEILIDNLKLNEHDNIILNSLNYLEEIYNCYSEVIGLKQNLFLSATSLTIDNNIGNIIPADWIFSPIVVLYSEHENDKNKIDENKQIFIVTRCLQWIFFYENYFPDLSGFINATDRYCRLGCIFLCSNTLFLEKDIHQLLELCFKMFIKPDVFNTLNFDKEIQGLNNFQDFYVQLLEQYQGVSYGDYLFANFILIPLIQKQNVKWRKILWSEYMGVAQTIILNLDQCYIDINEFLNPPETDLSLLKCYRRALVSGYLNRSPFLKQIATHHVENYIKCKKQ